ncbi:hypothetical protein MMC24_001546 [Lignoscripta atroalba]|nr:hypothetical protein [Lignoscripta atroalba]
MANITSDLNDALKKHSAHVMAFPRKRSQTTDEFLKEAYRINTHISSLRTYLLSIRQSYLTTTPPPRRGPSSGHGLANNHHQHQAAKDRMYFTDKQRDQIDAESKSTLRDLNAGIHQLAEAEQLRQNTVINLAQKRKARNGFKALGRWAAGGVGESSKKSPEEELEEARHNTIKVQRESVIWYLRRKLEEAAEVQRGMMELRLEREVERSKSVLYKTRGFKGVLETSDLGDMSGNGSVKLGGEGYRGGRTALMDETDRKKIEQQLSPEQLQLFARENTDMLKHYEDTLDQVRTAERSMLEISELQTTLSGNLETQAAHIDQLVADSMYTTENVGGGNKELKRATERKRWDLIF